MALTEEAQDSPSFFDEACDAGSPYDLTWTYNNELVPSQTVTSMEVNNGESITHSPYQQQPQQHAYQQQPHASELKRPNLNALTAPDAAENSSALQQQIPGEPIDTGNELGEEDGPPVARGRGYTGKAKGRPPGAKNKPKVPDDGLPKEPKKKGRPPGAKNKHPKGAHGLTLVPNAASRVVGPNERPITSAVFPERAVRATRVVKAVKTVKTVMTVKAVEAAVKAVEAPATPTLAPPEPTIPAGYAQVTDSNSQSGTDAGEQHSPTTMGDGGDFETGVGNMLKQYLRGNSSPPRMNSETHLTPHPPPPTPTPYPSVGYHAPAAHDDGHQYPDPQQLGDGVSPYRNEVANIGSYNEPPRSALVSANGHVLAPPPPRSALVSANDPVLAPSPPPEDALILDPRLF